MVVWHHWINGHEFEQSLGDTEEKGILMCCSPWGHRVGRDLATEQQQTRTSYIQHPIKTCQTNKGKKSVAAIDTEMAELVQSMRTLKQVL